MMSALKERMNLRRKAMAPSRKDEADTQATADEGDAPRPGMGKKWQSMPALPSQRMDDDDDAPISMKGMCVGTRPMNPEPPKADLLSAAALPAF